jgi:hypothetical protein
MMIDQLIPFDKPNEKNEWEDNELVHSLNQTHYKLPSRSRATDRRPYLKQGNPVPINRQVLYLYTVHFILYPHYTDWAPLQHIKCSKLLPLSYSLLYPLVAISPCCDRILSMAEKYGHVFMLSASFLLSCQRQRNYRCQTLQPQSEAILLRSTDGAKQPSVLAFRWFFYDSEETEFIPNLVFLN